MMSINHSALKNLRGLLRKNWVQQLILFTTLFFVTTLNEGIEIMQHHELRDGFYIFLLAYIHAQIHRYWVFPIFFKFKKPFWYALTSVLLIFLFALISFQADEKMVNFFGWYDDFPDKHWNLFWFYVLSYFVSLCIILFLILLIESFNKEKDEDEYKLLAKTMELNLLRNQLNPHFMFNTLNNLYGISLRQPDRVPDLLMEFSQLIRYQLEVNSKDWVTLEDTISFIQGYITLETERISNRCKVYFHISSLEDSRRHAKIAPMILFCYIENAFKHAPGATGDSFINIELTILNDCVLLEVKNSVPVRKQEIKSTGIGLENTKRRLDLLYPGKFELQIQREETLFEVSLRMDV